MKRSVKKNRFNCDSYTLPMSTVRRKLCPVKRITAQASCSRLKKGPVRERPPDFRGRLWNFRKKYVRPPESLSLCINLLTNFRKNTPSPHRYLENQLVCPLGLRLCISAGPKLEDMTVIDSST